MTLIPYSATVSVSPDGKVYENDILVEDDAVKIDGKWISTVRIVAETLLVTQRAETAKRYGVHPERLRVMHSPPMETTHPSQIRWIAPSNGLDRALARPQSFRQVRITGKKMKKKTKKRTKKPRSEKRLVNQLSSMMGLKCGRRKRGSVPNRVDKDD